MNNKMNKKHVSIFLSVMVLCVILYFSSCQKMDPPGSSMGIDGVYMMGSTLTPRMHSGAEQPKSPDKWQKMMATDLSTLQSGSSKTDKGNTILAVAFSPQGETRSIDEGDEITITFSEPVAPLQKIVKNAPSLIEIEPALKGEGYWKSSTTYAYRIDQKRKLSSRYNIRFRGYTAISGKIVQEKKWSFTTPTIQISNSIPYDQSRWQTLDQKTLIKFTMDVDPNAIGKFISIDTSQGFPPFTARYSTKEERKLVFWNAENDPQTKNYITIIPNQPLPIASDIKVILKAGLPPIEGNIGLKSDRVINFRTYEIFKLVSVSGDFSPSEGIHFVFSNPVRINYAAKKIAFSPKLIVSKDGDWDSDDFYLSASYVPGTLYTYTIPGDLQDKFGNKLGAAQKYNGKCLDYPEGLFPPTAPHFVLEDYLEKKIPVNVMNVYKTDVLYKPLEIPDLRKLYTDEWDPLKPGKMDTNTCSTYNWSTGARKNRLKIAGFDLDAIRSDQPGYYFIKFAGATPEYYEGNIFQLTDIALVAKYSPTQIFVMPFNMKTGEIVPNLTYKIENFNPQTPNSLGTIKGNGDGIGIFQPAESVLETNSLYDCFVFSEPRKGFVWGKKYEMYDMWNFYSDPGFRYDESATYASYPILAFTDKHLYKAGQTVQFKGIVRKIVGGPLQVPQIKSINAEVFDSRGQSLKKFNITPDKITPYGSFSGDFNLPDTTPSGFARIEFKVMVDKTTISHSLGFSVQEYKPAKFEVSLAFDQPTLIAGQTFSGNLNSRYLFGTPMKNAEGKLTMTIDSTYFTPEGYDAYSFGSYEYKESETILRKDFTLDNDGNYKFDKKPITIESKNSVSLSVYGEVKDKDNNIIGTSKSTILHRGEYYIGVKTDSYFFKQDKPGKIQVVTVNPQGKLVKNTQVDLKITREEWKSFQQKDASGALRWEWKKETEDILTDPLTVSNGTLEKEYKFAKPGFYTLELTGEDNLNNTITTTGYLYVTGSGYISWGVNEGRTIDIVTDKKSYKPGENIEVLIKSPFEKSVALVTAEREQVIWSKVVHLNGNANTVQVPVQKEFMPNVYINVTILKERTGVKFDEKGKDIGKPEFYAGYKLVSIDATEKKLNIEITPNQKSYEPGNDVKLDIKVTDMKGAPVKSELCISIVDKGVLNLVGYQLPDPFEFFWAKRALQVKTVSTLSDVLGRRKFGEKGENQGGDAGGSAFGSVVVRKNFKESAYYTAFIVTDDKGKAMVTFKLPDNLTTFKAMVVGGNTNNQFGRSTKDLLVKQSLILKPALPDFIRPMDKFSAGVTVTNNTDGKFKAAVQLTCEGIQQDKGDDNVKKVSLDPGETQAVWFKFTAGSTMAPAKLTFKAAAGKSTDGLYAEIPVRAPQFIEAVSSFGRVENTPVKEQLIVPTGTVRTFDKVEITLASSAMVGVKRNFDLLQEYPYDCLEQRISKQYPLVAASGFLLTYKLLDMSQKDIQVRIGDLLKIMPQYQAPSGGFKYYADCIFPSPYLTCYAVEFIIDAKKKGYYYDPQSLKKAEEYLKLVANMKIDPGYPYSSSVKFLVQSYAVYALSKDNIFVKDAINNLFEVRDRIPFTGISYLVRALDIKNSLPAHMQPVLAKTMINKMKDEPTMTHFENQEDSSWCWVHESNVKTTSIVLDTLLSVYGKFPYAEKIARWLANSTNQKRFFSTQDHIRLFMAFEKYYRTFEKDTPNFVSEVLFNGMSKAKETFSGRDLTARTKQFMLNEYKPNDKIDVTFKKDGTGILYYLLRMKYYPLGEVEAIDRGFKVEKVYKKMDGSVVKDNTFKPGEKYLVEITVDTKSEHSFVMMDDPVPAGLKVLNPNFETSTVAAMKKTTRENEWNAYWGKFYRSEIYFDRMQVFADYLVRGKHVWKYLVVATNEGSYNVPNTVVVDMYNLDVFGRNANRNVVVK